MIFRSFLQNSLFSFLFSPPLSSFASFTVYFSHSLPLYSASVASLSSLSSSFQHFLQLQVQSLFLFFAFLEDIRYKIIIIASFRSPPCTRVVFVVFMVSMLLMVLLIHHGSFFRLHKTGGLDGLYGVGGKAFFF